MALTIRAVGDTTHCSDFVRDFWSQLGMPATTDLAGQANDQVTALTSSANWNKFAFANAADADLQGAFSAADSAASAGTVVLVGWLNPAWTPGDMVDHGHIAIVVPSRRNFPSDLDDLAEPTTALHCSSRACHFGAGWRQRLCENQFELGLRLRQKTGYDPVHEYE